MLELDPGALELLDTNLLESAREVARWNDAAECVESGGLLLIACASNFPIGYTNCAIRVDPGLSPGLVLSRAREFFADRGRGFTVFVRGHRDADLEAALEGAELPRIAETPCMIIRRPIAEAPPIEGFTLRAMQSKLEAHDAVYVDSEAYTSLGMPAAETHALLAKPERLLTHRILGVVAYRDDAPVSTAFVLRSAGAAGVYWVATLESARRSGLAEACTRWVTNAAFEAGESMVTLQASHMGEPIYRRLGYETFDSLRWYLAPAPA